MLTYKQLRTDIEKGKQKPQLSLVAMHEWQSPQVFENNKNFMVMLKASYSWENSDVEFPGKPLIRFIPIAYAYPRYPGSPPLTNLLFSRADDKIFSV